MKLHVPECGDQYTLPVRSRNLLYPVTKEHGTRRKFLVIDIAVQGQVHSEDELCRATKPPCQVLQNSLSCRHADVNLAQTARRSVALLLTTVLKAKCLPSPALFPPSRIYFGEQRNDTTNSLHNIFLPDHGSSALPTSSRQAHREHVDRVQNHECLSQQVSCVNAASTFRRSSSLSLGFVCATSFPPFNSDTSPAIPSTIRHGIGALSS